MSSTRSSSSKAEVLTLIDRAVRPGVMSRSEAKEFLEELREEIYLRLECLLEEGENVRS